ncbi:MAG: glycoside hydrolase family 32 protein [Acutalibacter sp.]|jgi:beta-fructofuranosidase
MSETLQRARDYEKDVLSQIPGEQRPAFHVSSLVGWANDPNGFSLYQGEYHLFYQYHPYSVQWGPMHWGHYKSKDLVKWEPVPCAIAPDQDYDVEGCFSGGAVEWQGKHYLLYTGVSKTEDGQVRQTQCVAVGDGVNYEKLPQNPVMTGEMLPEGSSLEDFRDPKVWREGDRFWAVIGSRSDDTSGQLALFSSPDMERWEFVTILDRCRNEYGKMWECPDFFQLDGKTVALISPQEMQAQGLEFHNGNANVCLIGSYDPKTHAFTRESAAAIDYGMDFYATQSLESPDGRRILIAWMQNWENYMTPAGYKWSGMMTFPRELRVKDGHLCQTPVREIAGYYTHSVKAQGSASQDYQELEGVSGRVFDMTVTLDPATCQNLEIRLGVEGRFYTSLQYQGAKGLFVTDRTYSGNPKDVLSVRAMELPAPKGPVELRVLMDKYSVEVFVDGGQRVMTSLVYGPLTAEGIRFAADGPFQVEFHQISEKINGELSL